MELIFIPQLIRELKKQFGEGTAVSINIENASWGSEHPNTVNLSYQFYFSTPSRQGHILKYFSSFVDLRTFIQDLLIQKIKNKIVDEFKQKTKLDSMTVDKLIQFGGFENE